MEEKIINALKDAELQEGHHYLELDLGDGVMADLSYKLDYDVKQTFTGTHLQPPEWEIQDCEFDIISLFIADEHRIYPNDNISIHNINRQIQKHLLK